MFCSCGCGEKIKQTRLVRWKIKNGQKNFYIRGHQYKSGSNNHNWNGGKYTDNKGYHFVKMPNHPNARKNGYVAESHLVVSKKIGRPIDTTVEVVHHINGDKTDNRIDNLSIVTRKKHTSFHTVGDKNGNYKNTQPKICPNCKKEFLNKPNHNRDKCCSIKCRTEYYRGEKGCNTKITQKIADEIKSLKGELSSRKISALYGISPTHTKRILRGDIW